MRSVLRTLSLPVYQNVHVDSVCERVSFKFDVYFIFTGNIYNTKGNISLEEFPMLLMDRNLNPFAISNKQAHIISGNLPELRYGDLGFSLTQVSR